MLQVLKNNHREIARMTFEGSKPAEIAEALGMSVSRVRVVVTDPLFKSHLAKLSDSADCSTIAIRKKLSLLSVKAVETIDDLLSSNDVPASTQLRAAEAVLNRTGHSTQVDHKHVHAHITTDDLAELKKRAKDNGAELSDGSELKSANPSEDY